MAGQAHSIRAAISIHALCEEGDTRSPVCRPRFVDFYPRPLRGGRRSLMVTMPFLMRFLSTPSARRATGFNTLFNKAFEISIHALCEEGDFMQFFLCAGHHVISIHALCEEGDACRPARCEGPYRFLSTPSARRATAEHFILSLLTLYFYPRPLRGGRLHARLRLIGSCLISIHALCEEGDSANFGRVTSVRLFLSTPSARRATAECPINFLIVDDFYPRPLRGGRLFRGRLPRLLYPISIHALCEEGDLPGPPGQP